MSHERVVQFLQAEGTWPAGGYAIEALAGGMSNQAYRLRGADEDLVMRLLQPCLFVDRASEEAILQQVACLGIAPRILQRTDRYMLFEYLPGTTFTPDDFADEALRSAFVDCIQRLHTSGLQLPRVFEPWAAIGHQLEEFAKNGEAIAPQATLDQILGHLASVAQSVAHLPLVPCHLDLVPLNLIKTGRPDQPVMLIDWEYAGMAPALLDFAHVFLDIHADPVLERSVLAAYCAAHDLDAALQQVQGFKQLAAFYWAMWSHGKWLQTRDASYLQLKERYLVETLPWFY